MVDKNLLILGVAKIILLHGITFVYGDELLWAFAGGKPEGLAVLNALHDAGFKPSLIFAPSTFPSDDLQQIRFFAEKLTIPFVVSNDLSRQQSKLKKMDLLLTCRFELISRNVFNSPKFGSVNIHPSLLPQYRGVHPLSWAIINDESESGVSIHKIDEGIDTGPLLLQKSFEITDDDDIVTIGEKAKNLSVELSLDFFKIITETGRLPFQIPYTRDASYAPRRGPEDGEVDLSMTARQIFKMSQALQHPLPYAFLIDEHGNKRLIQKACLERFQGALPPFGWEKLKTQEGNVFVKWAEDEMVG